MNPRRRSRNEQRIGKTKEIGNQGNLEVKEIRQSSVFQVDGNQARTA
jgi:hypothetical protein